MTPAGLHVAVPGPLDQRTGGYLYDARMVAGLRAAGWDVEVHELAGSFPEGDETARAALDGMLASLPDGARVLVDGLAMGGLPEPIRAHGSRLRILALVHHPLADETGLSCEVQRRLRASEQEALAPCRGVIVTSRYTERRLREAYDVPADRVRAVPPGTEPAREARGPGPDEAPRLLCVATVTPRKGHDVLAAALERIADLRWSCVCAGSLDRDPAHARRVQERLREAGLRERVTFVGEHDPRALDRLYDRSSIFVLASFYEGYGMALAEALARGLPVVSTRGGAIPFTVPEDVGILVDPGDDAALAAALRSLVAPGSQRRSELARRARRHAATLPTWEESVRAFARAVVDLTE